MRLTELSPTVTRILVDPRFRVPYHTYSIEGFAQAGIATRFRRTDAPAGEGMALVAGDRRIWVDTNDSAQFDEAAYAWCDTFAKVNCTAEEAGARSKVLLLGPVFGIQRWRLPAGYLVAARLSAAGANPRATLQGVRFQGLTRLPITSYVPGTSDPTFVFHRSRAWAGKHDGTNAPRERFIAALESLSLRSSTALTDARIPLARYLELTARSAITFNCPAVHACLGWKLGEYLALGKAILSTPLNRELPAPLVHGTHIHYVEDDVDAMREAIERLTTDHAYRLRLEHGARDWYEQNLAPRQLATRILGR